MTSRLPPSDVTRTDRFHIGELEARLIGLDPVFVTERAGTAHQAIHGAVRKPESALERTLGKHDPKARHQGHEDVSDL